MFMIAKACTMNYKRNLYETLSVSQRVCVSQVAIQHNLDGVVANNAHLFKEMDQITRLKTAGKCLLTYGSGNTDPEMILKQVAAGVNGLCTDDISVCNNMITAAKLLESALPALYDTMLPVAAQAAALATLPTALPTAAVSVV